MGPLDDSQTARELGNIEARLGSIERCLDRLPCRAHGEDIATLKAKAGMYGAVSGAISSVLVAVGAVLMRR